MHRETRRVRTETKGIMQEIREHLESGEATGQVIALGYKPGTVYKVNQWLQREGTGRSGAAICEC